MPRPVPVIDIFAGPGGLGEGFAGLRDAEGEPGFKIRLSVEKDRFAHQTLELRSFYRQFRPGEVPEEYYAVLRGGNREALFNSPDLRIQAKRARSEALLAELGGREHPSEWVDDRIRRVLGRARHWVLVGGPPCQAYSVVGRSRNKGVKGYSPEKDDRHFLYREYLRIIAEHWPSVFVMENVKGLLSARVKNEGIYRRIFEDLLAPGDAVCLRTSRGARCHTYRIYSLVSESIAGDVYGDPSDFVLFAERYGIPQTRHRVILLGIRDDLGTIKPRLLTRAQPVPAEDVLAGLPRLRAGLSREEDSPQAWERRIQEARLSDWLTSLLGDEHVRGPEVFSRVIYALDRLSVPQRGRGGEFVRAAVDSRYRRSWFIDPMLGGACNHATREHMASDLHRYLFAACFAKVNGVTPKLRNFPEGLLPEHKNIGMALKIRHFADRFRVQIGPRPATTITSHIHKDGHYYEAPDPMHCHSFAADVLLTALGSLPPDAGDHRAWPNAGIGQDQNN